MERISKSRRTRLISVAGEPCDFVESLAMKISVKELRSKVATSKKLKASRISFLREGVALMDGDEVTYEVRHVGEGEEGRMELCSTGEPIQMILAAAKQVVYEGRVKAFLHHYHEYDTFQLKEWASDWVTVTMETNDLGESMNDELRIFIGEVDLVRYGRLKDPHHRQLETWENKDAGTLKLTVCKEMSGPRNDAPGRYEITQQHVRVYASSNQRDQLGTLDKGVTVDVLEVQRTAPKSTQVTGRIDFEGKTGWLPLMGMFQQSCAIRCDQERLYKLELERRCCVERGDGKYCITDSSELWFQEEKERDEFVAAFRAWELANPQPPLWSRKFQEVVEEEEEEEEEEQE